MSSVPAFPSPTTCWRRGATERAEVLILLFEALESRVEMAAMAEMAERRTDLKTGNGGKRWPQGQSTVASIAGRTLAH